MWSLTSWRVRRASGPENFRSSAKKDFFNTIRQKRSFHNAREHPWGRPYPTAAKQRQPLGLAWRAAPRWSMTMAALIDCKNFSVARRRGECVMQAGRGIRPNLSCRSRTPPEAKTPSRGQRDVRSAPKISCARWMICCLMRFASRRCRNLCFRSSIHALSRSIVVWSAAREAIRVACSILRSSSRGSSLWSWTVSISKTVQIRALFI